MKLNEIKKMKLKDIKKQNPEYAHLTKKKIKKQMRKDRIVPADKQNRLDLKKKKQSKRETEKMFQKSLKKNFITDGLCLNSKNSIPNEHAHEDTRDSKNVSRYADHRNGLMEVVQTAPTVIVDLDFPIFREKNVK